MTKKASEEVKKMALKTAKGTRDYNEKEMTIRQNIFDTITKVFKGHGAVTIDTPVFELKEILSGKYGEDSKLIYDLQDQGGEICSLRYDLTVPFARFVAMNGPAYQNIKRYQIAKVYRRDQPSLKKGRMREFYQCDFDIAGIHESMVPDAEVLRVAYEILNDLSIGKFTIKINHRKLLDGMFQFCGVPTDKIRPISSAVDKLDKMSWELVKKEMVNEKGLDESIADKIGTYVKLHGGVELCELLEKDQLITNELAKQGVSEMKTLFKYLELFKVDTVLFDLSLARGLDYYTGVIYEAVFNNTEKDDDLDGIGSIAAGGRYDELVGMYGSQQIPCVGVSIGVERIYSLILAKSKMDQVRSTETQVYVCGIGPNTLDERMKVCTELWNAGIKAEFMYKGKLEIITIIKQVKIIHFHHQTAKPKLPLQFSYCEKQGIPIAILIGEGEIEKNVVNIKDQRIKGTEQQITVERSEMIDQLKKMLI